MGLHSQQFTVKFTRKFMKWQWEPKGSKQPSRRGRILILYLVNQYARSTNHFIYMTTSLLVSFGLLTKFKISLASQLTFQAQKIIAYSQRI